MELFEQYYPDGWEFRRPSSRGRPRTLVEGIGVNDAWYTPKPYNNGKQLKCPAFRAWGHMIMRAYSLKYHVKCPTYKDVEVCEEWKTFSNFRYWYFTELSKTPWMPGEFELDKDILGSGKLYCPDCCLLVPTNLNNFLTVSSAARGDYPIGVNWDKKAQKFQAKVSGVKKRKHLGYFDCPDEAHIAWLTAKLELCDTIDLPDHWSGDFQRRVRGILKVKVAEMV